MIVVREEGKKEKPKIFLYLCILFHDIFRVRSKENVKIKNPANCTVCYGWLRLQGNIYKE